MRTLHGSPGRRVRDRAPTHGDPSVTMFWWRRETGRDVGCVQRWWRRHAPKLSLKSRGVECAIVPRVACIRPSPCASAQPRRNQPPRRKQPSLRRTAYLPNVAQSGPVQAWPRSDICFIVTVAHDRRYWQSDTPFTNLTQNMCSSVVPARRTIYDNRGGVLTECNVTTLELFVHLSGLDLCRQNLEQIVRVATSMFSLRKRTAPSVDTPRNDALVVIWTWTNPCW